LFSWGGGGRGPRQGNQYSEYTAYWMVWGSNPEGAREDEMGCACGTNGGEEKRRNFVLTNDVTNEGEPL
jgi:hypothetical protein